MRSIVHCQAFGISGVQVHVIDFELGQIEFRDELRWTFVNISLASLCIFCIHCQTSSLACVCYHVSTN